MSAVATLERWFNGLNRAEQEEVIKFLYEGRVLLQEGKYFGPAPQLVIKGLHCGPAPQASTGASNICPTCRRPL